ncbi:MAG: zinc ribbon domain-containing protein [Kiritimatiellae bacterium]|nr:zinc ribbon domain-containing protein [Kiritimatiellia bacterium]MDD4737572.1 zinc ribbon domain-containing protein [Kiritimatiellia bacterium]
MPTYEYECQKCGHRFDVFQSITEKPKQRCPKCRGKVKRLLGAGAGFLFKGSGFYATDYRSDSYKNAQKAEHSAASETKKESPPATSAAPASDTKKKTAKAKEKA